MSELAALMARSPVPAAFTRPQWAYLINAVRSLPARPAGGRPRSPIVLWLPGNAPLLGAHAVTLAAWTGAEVVAKPPSGDGDLTEAWVAWVRERSPLLDAVTVRRGDHALAAELSAGAGARIVFGSDEAVAAIEALPHPPGPFAGFGARRSEAWLDRGALRDEAALRTLVRAFAVFGRAGCTSPARVVAVGAEPHEADELRDRLAALWPLEVSEPVEMHVASQNAMAAQVAAAKGWRPVRTPAGAAVLAAGPIEAGALDVGPATLPIVAASLEQAVASTPPDLQTVGFACADPRSWQTAVAQTAACRFVPLSEMHVFGPVWDGIDWWDALWR